MSKIDIDKEPDNYQEIIVAEHPPDIIEVSKAIIKEMDRKLKEIKKRGKND